MDQTYANILKQYLTQPGSYQASPGYQFALDQATQAANRGMAATGQRDSGNALAALTKLGAGYASQDYGASIDRLGKLAGQEETYDLGLGANANTATRNANDLALGTEGNRLTGVRDANSLALGTTANANTAQRDSNDFDLGVLGATNTYNLGHEANTNTAQNNWLQYALGVGRNANDASANQNSYNLGVGRNATDQFNAETQRGSAQSNAWNADQANQRAWYSVYPRQRVAGAP